MSQSKQRKSSTLWIQCDNCSTSITNREVESHSGDCPPNLSNITYNFIKDSILYGTLDIKTNEDIKHLTPEEIDNLVFVSQSAIQLCSLAIGSYAIVQLVNDANIPPVAKVVWPTVEKSLTSVLFSKNGLDLSFGNTDKNVKVFKTSDEILPARCVTVFILNSPKALEVTAELVNKVSNVHADKLLTVGNRLSVKFYGKLLKLEVKSIEGADTDANIENSFSKLCIEDQHEFYRTCESTKWVIYRDQEHYMKGLRQEEALIVLGLDEEIQEITELMNTALGKGKTKRFNFPYSKSVLLYGHSGTGKTTMAKYLGKVSKANVVSISACDLYTKCTSTVEESIQELFKEAMEQAPSIVILDEVDILCPVRSSKITETEKRIVSTLLGAFDNLSGDSQIFIIATTTKPDSIDPAFRRCGRLDRELEIPTPSPKSRKAILTGFLQNIPNSLNEEQLQEISRNTHGFVGADLMSLCSRAGMNALKREDDRVNSEDFKFALKKVRPSAMREVQIEVPNVKWTDIGGLENVKLILRQAVEWPLKHPECFSRLGITPPKGVLMFGPPGCSKTMIAKALATESGLNFLSIKGPELFSKWVGESEKAVREVFRKARQVAPSVIFFDEIDAIGGERSSGSSTSVQERVLAQLLTELDGVTPLGDVTILAATNRPDRMDKALLRPGRLDRIVYVPLPDKDTRKEIFRIKLSRMPVLNVDIDDLVRKTEGYSGAEVNAVCHEAAMMALEESLEIQYVECRHFDKALKLVTPRTPSSLIKLYEDYLKIKL